MAKKPLKPATVESVHEEINARAAELANIWAEEDIYGTLSNVFRQPGLKNPFRLRTVSSVIGIEFREGVLPFILPEDIEALRAIAHEALQQAIVEKGEKFVGVILGEARKKTNYFDKWHRD